MLTIVICALCGKEIEGTKYKTHSRKRYHYECFAALQDKAEIAETITKASRSSQEMNSLKAYICKVFKFERVPHLIEKQISDYTTKGDYTITGIEKTLCYFFEVLGNASEEQYGIGIVPYIYEEAKEFYQKSFEVNQINERTEIAETTETVRIKPQNRNLQCKTKIEDL